MRVINALYNYVTRELDLYGARMLIMIFYFTLVVGITLITLFSLRTTGVINLGAETPVVVYAPLTGILIIGSAMLIAVLHRYLRNPRPR